MKKLILKYGLICGGLLLFFMFSSSLVWGDKMDYVMATVIGYMTMLISFIPVYLGIKDIRNSHFIGFISIVEALKAGIGILLVATFIYVIGYMVFYELIGREFMESSHIEMVESLKSSYETKDAIEQQINTIIGIKEKYENPINRIGYALADILPPGLVIALLSSLFLMRKR